MQVLLLDTLETAPTIATSEMRAATTLLRLALCCRFKYRTIGALSASVFVVCTIVVVIVMVSVVVFVVAAAGVVVDSLLFGCESRSGADRPAIFSALMSFFLWSVLLLVPSRYCCCPCLSCETVL